MNRIKELRKSKNGGMTQQELAEAVNIPKRTIQRLENSESQIKLEKAQQLADFFGVSVGYLLGYIDEEQEKQLAETKKAIIKEIQDLSDFAKTNDISSQIDSITQNEGLAEFLYNLDKVFVQIESKEEYSDEEKEALYRLDHEILALIDMMFDKRLRIQKLKRD